ncbi:HD domain-containing protein [Micromonospora rifamycinica]|uniref:HD domain-containing protein n=1 Tax=Micromonospora rifamycinica TaxID=291594 RepID=UPI003F57EC28
MPAASASDILRWLNQYEADQTPEAVFVRDADKLEYLVHAVEYRHCGHQVPRFPVRS